MERKLTFFEAYGGEIKEITRKVQERNETLKGKLVTFASAKDKPGRVMIFNFLGDNNVMYGVDSFLGPIAVINSDLPAAIKKAMDYDPYPTYEDYLADILKESQIEVLLKREEYREGWRNAYRFAEEWAKRNQDRTDLRRQYFQETIEFLSQSQEEI